MNDREIKLIEGIYAGNEINETLDITEEDVELTCGDACAKGKAKVQFDFIPRPRLKFDIKFDDNFIEIAHLFSSPKKESIKFVGRDLELNIICTNKFLSTDAHFRIVAIPTRQPITLVKNENISEVIFHVVNFFDFWGADGVRFQTAEKIIAGNKFSLGHGKFEILIQSLPQTPDLIKKLDEQGGYAITHVGSIKRLDGKVFKADKTNGILDDVFYFLSFVRGFWAPPIFPLGFDSHKNKAWEKWGCIHISTWKYVDSWFDYCHGNILPDLFTSFLKKMQSIIWSKNIKSAIYWFILANAQSAADAAIILIQAALERLSWVYHVEATQSISPEGFSKLPAADQLRLLLLHARIPIKVPNELEDLSVFAKKNNFDGPGAFTYIRNRLVHPPKGKEKEYLPNAVFQSWRLGLWYLELILLNFFEYKGAYGNRLKLGRWVGQTEPVPWA